MSEHFVFWKMVYDMGAITVDMLREATLCETNRFGEITKDEFKIICGEDFDTNKEKNLDIKNSDKK